MNRREFITLVGGAPMWPVVSRAQLGRVPLIGVLAGLPQSDPIGKQRMLAFEQGLAHQGWTVGGNLRIEIREAGAAANDKVQIFAKELVALNCDVILAQGTVLLLAASRETRSRHTRGNARAPAHHAARRRWRCPRQCAAHRRSA